MPAMNEAAGTRTPDLRIKSPLLCHLSYSLKRLRPKGLYQSATGVWSPLTPILTPAAIGAALGRNRAAQEQVSNGSPTVDLSNAVQECHTR